MKNRKHPQSQQPTQSTDVVDPTQPVIAQPTAEQVADAAEAKAELETKRSLQVARDTNAANPKVDPTAPVRAVLVRPAKGENPQRRKVFGYDNGPGGKVPVGAKVVVINAASLKAAYPSLAEAVETSPEATVGVHKSAGVAGKSFRRAFRAGLIRFSQD